MVGNHNASCLASLNSIREGFEDSKDLPQVLILAGPSGSGKTTIIQKFVQDLTQDIRLTTSQMPKFVFEADATKFDNYGPLWTRISKFTEPVIERFITANFRMVVIDNADQVPPSQQQFLKRIMEMIGKRARWIFVCRDMKKLITYIQTMALNFNTNSISERNGLMVILSLCHRNKIGYDREGIHAVVNMHLKDMSLSKIIDLMQKVFVEYSYLSAENVAKVAGATREKPKIAITEILQPMERCKICTLFPPCKHITLEMMVAQAETALANIPRVKPLTLSMFNNAGGSAIPLNMPLSSSKCSEYITFGHCSLYTKYGRCPLDHPKDLHRLIYPVRRCSQCTIPWPCNHCEYSESRKLLIRTIKSIETRLHLLKQLVVPDPLINVAVWLVSLNEHPLLNDASNDTYLYCALLQNDLYPSWKMVMGRYEKKFLTKSMEDALISTISWLHNGYSQVIEEYRLKNRLITMSYQELLESPMLDKPALRRAITGDAEDMDEGREDSNDEFENEASHNNTDDNLSVSAGSISVQSQLDTGAIMAASGVAGTAEAAFAHHQVPPLGRRGSK
jgi:nucleoside-triphosphatase THEP1